MRYRVVTKEQINEGYVVVDGTHAIHRHFNVIKKNRDNTYVVEEPEPEPPPCHDPNQKPPTES